MIEDTTNSLQMGFIADAVKLVVPEVIAPSVDENGDELNFKVYCKLTALLVEGIKELNNNYISSVSSLNTIINNHTSSITSLHTRVDVLELQT